jgi:hypothetical protein
MSETILSHLSNTATPPTHEWLMRKNIMHCQVIEQELKLLLDEMIEDASDTEEGITGIDQQIATLSEMQFQQQNKKIVQIGDEIFLIPVNKEIDDLSAQERAEAHIAYQRLKPEAREAIARAQADRAQQAALIERKTMLQMRREHLQQDILIMANQLVSLQAAYAAAEQELQQSQSTSTTMPPLRLIPRPTPTTQAVQQVIPKTFARILMQKKQFSAPILAELKTWAKIHAPHLQNDLSTIRPGIPIPATTLQALLVYLRRYGVGADRLNFNPILNPNEHPGPGLK